MKIIISPAKKMNDIGDEISGPGKKLCVPVFLEDAEKIQESLQNMDFEEQRKLWACNEKIAALGRRRLQEYSISLYRKRAGERGLPFLESYLSRCTPALLAYEGIQYQYMAPQVFTNEQWDYATEHLRILSGFYGILSPMDGVIPYRLEMQAKLKLGGTRNLYEYWGRRIFDELTKDSDLIVNLASKEYSKVVEKYLTPKVRYITCIFGEKTEGKIKTKGTRAKMARGEMVRYLAERRADQAEQLKEFKGLGYCFVPGASTEDTYVFLRNGD